MVGFSVGSVADICTSRNARECSFEFLRSCSNGRGSDTDCNYCEAVFSKCKELPSAPATDEPSFCSMTLILIVSSLSVNMCYIQIATTIIIIKTDFL